MKFTVLSSGSKGNALLVQSGETTVMVEAGLGPRVLKERLEMAGLAGTRPSALFVTHGHYDHCKHAAETAEAFNIPTLATPECAMGRVHEGIPFFAHQPLSTRVPVKIGPLTIQAFATPHDAPGSVGLVFDDGESRLGFATDLGCVTSHIVAALRDCSLLYTEFNHDVDMLKDGPYPASLKRRVLSNVGHLSNEQAAYLVARARTPSLKTLVLAHLSEANNTPQLALAAAHRVVDGHGVTVHVAQQRSVLGPLVVARPPQRAPVALPLVTVPVRAPVAVAARARKPARYGTGPTAQLSLFGALE